MASSLTGDPVLTLHAPSISLPARSRSSVCATHVMDNVSMLLLLAGPPLAGEAIRVRAGTDRRQAQRPDAATGILEAD